MANNPNTESVTARLLENSRREMIRMTEEFIKVLERDIKLHENEVNETDQIDPGKLEDYNHLLQLREDLIVVRDDYKKAPCTTTMARITEKSYAEITHRATQVSRRMHRVPNQAAHQY